MNYYDSLKNGTIEPGTPDHVLIAYIANSHDIPRLPDHYRINSPDTPEQALLSAIAYQQQSDASMQRVFALMNRVVDSLPDLGNALAAAAGHDHATLATMLHQEKTEKHLVGVELYVDEQAVKEMKYEDRMLLQHVDWNVPVYAEFSISDGFETKIYSADYTCFGHLSMHADPGMDIDVLEAGLQKEMASNLDVEIEAMRIKASVISR